MGLPNCWATEEHCYSAVSDFFSFPQQMPHYHAKEATRYIQKVLGNYYQKDSRNVLRATWEDFSSCAYVAPDEPNSGILWYRK